MITTLQVRHNLENKQYSIWIARFQETKNFSTVLYNEFQEIIHEAGNQTMEESLIDVRNYLNSNQIFAKGYSNSIPTSDQELVDEFIENIHLLMHMN